MVNIQVWTCLKNSLQGLTGVIRESYNKKSTDLQVEFFIRNVQMEKPLFTLIYRRFLSSPIKKIQLDICIKFNSLLKELSLNCDS